VQKVILRYSRNMYGHVCNLLVKERAFEDVSVVDSAPSFVSHITLLVRLVRVVAFLLHRRKFRNADKILCVGTESTLPVLLLNRLGLISSSTIYLWGFFFHNAKYNALLQRALPFIVRCNIHLILFSEYELRQWQTILGARASASYIPYCQTSQSSSTKDRGGDYYFSGGYSNRDYASLIDVFQSRQEKLVIVCSRHNKDVPSHIHSGNISIYRDLDEHSFDRLLAESKACIFPFRHNTGASGQSVMIRSMRHKKLVICTDTDIIREYVHDGKTGVLLDNIRISLPSTLDMIGSDPAHYQYFGEQLYLHYVSTFSPDAFEKNILKQVEA
jgi:glycosyltransferase involved in cell wall biosynthesis